MTYTLTNMKPIASGKVEAIVDEWYMVGATPVGKSVIVDGQSFPIEVWSEIAGERAGQELKDPVYGDKVSVYSLGPEGSYEIVGVIEK